MDDERPRVMRPLTRLQAMAKLRTVPMGRIAFTHRAMPAIRPVNHVIDPAGRIIIRSHEGAAIVTVTDSSHGTVVGYEADDIDTVARTGWSVVTTGFAHLVDDPRQASQYRAALHPWVTGEQDYIIRIEPSIMTGYELAEESGPGGPEGPRALQARRQ
jgi:hypothetical protein